MAAPLTWYARRLRAMSRAEVADRTRRTLGHGVDAAIYHATPPLWRTRWQPDVDALLSGPLRQQPLGFLGRDRAVALGKLLPHEAERLVVRASSVLEGRYRFFGYPEVVLGPDRGGDVDPFSGRTWPRSHAKRIDYRRHAVGDPKWIWELNRCQDLPLLAAAWLLDGDDRYGQAVGERLQSWIAGHPPGRGIAWANGFEPGVRAISLAVATDALRGSAHLPADRAEQAVLALWQHARWIERDPSTGSSANNHLIGELVGLIVIGCLVPELADSSRLVDDAVAKLENEVELQIRPDGTSVEQAFGYHVFVLDLLLVAVAALDRQGRVLPSRIRTALEHSADALWAQLDGDEPDPTYGDSDDSRALAVDGRDRRYARGVAAAIAARLGHGKAARVARELDATAFWLFGEEGAKRFAATELAAGPGSVTLPDGGLTMLRRGRLRATLDHGPHGHLGIAAHAHADALRLDLSSGPTELVVDPGVGSYAQPRLREAFRSTGFHGTVLVDGRSSSTPGGPFLWTEHARSRLLFADLDARLVIAEHDGYSRLDDPVTHRRAVAVLEDESVLVLDRLEGRRPHLYAQHWPLHPGLVLERQTDDGVVVRGADVGLALAFAASHPLSVKSVRGEPEPPCGWWSERLESVEPSLLLTTELGAAGPVHVAALLLPFASKAVPAASLTLRIGDDLVGIEVVRSGTTDLVEVAFGTPSMGVRRQPAAPVA